MNALIRNLSFWSFQIINTLTAFFMTGFPKQFHESLFRNAELVYRQLGFSGTAVEMVHNVIRGHGAVLLAVSAFIWIEGVKSRSVYLLIAIVCALSVYAHIMTLNHHVNNPQVVSALGGFGSLYGVIILTGVVGLLSGMAYTWWKD
jgi:hypothetical protein